MIIQDALQITLTKEEARDIRWLQLATSTDDDPTSEILHYIKFVDNTSCAVDGFRLHKSNYAKFDSQALLKVNNGKLIKEKAGIYLAQAYNGIRNFPDVDLVFPKPSMIHAEVRVDILELRSAVAQFVPFGTLKISFDKSRLVLNSDTLLLRINMLHKVDNAETYLFSPQYLVDALSMPVEGTVTLNFTSAVSPMSITSPYYQAVIMPKRLERK